jgi:hypothetical protein
MRIWNQTGGFDTPREIMRGYSTTGLSRKLPADISFAEGEGEFQFG